MKFHFKLKRGDEFFHVFFDKYSDERVDKMDYDRLSGREYDTALKWDPSVYLIRIGDLCILPNKSWCVVAMKESEMSQVEYYLNIFGKNILKIDPNSAQNPIEAEIIPRGGNRNSNVHLVFQLFL